MNKIKVFKAVITDMDGVLTKTARLHEEAWKQMFDEYLKKNAHNEKPFSSSDYRKFVDGKPRYMGVEDFLSSRGIHLPYGDPADAPLKETICGLGNRKNNSFQQLLEKKGVTVFEDALLALKRWRRFGLKIAAISASQNAEKILKTAQLTEYFDTIVSGTVAKQLNLSGKEEIFSEAVKRLGVQPAHIIAIEDALAGVRAAKKNQLGLVVAIDRTGDYHDLKKAGADEVVHKLTDIHFPHQVPNALENIQNIVNFRQHKEYVFFLDYDGTLTPIVENPDAAHLSDKMKNILIELANHWRVIIVSGRNRPDVKEKIQLNDLIYAGNHGFDIKGPHLEKALPEAEEAVSRICDAKTELQDHFSDMKGIIIEPKRFSVAIHYRKVSDEKKIKDIKNVITALAQKNNLRQRKGKKVIELEPPIDWNKGKAITWLMKTLSIDAQKTTVLYIGDDTTDEDAFSALENTGIGIHVGNSISHTIADYQLATPEEVSLFLQKFLQDGI